ncbi:CAP domain-containing protein [Streptomyces avermitilis]|uniref:CAP domain-containing protein n=1 Tax=Streptomyces avermitilis TaxID=33903 RepID=UPI00368023E1
MSQQTDWRFCGKCQAMFFDGYPKKGACPTSGSHKAVGYNFCLPYDVAGTSADQMGWRFCVKCDGVFFYGTEQPNDDQETGICPFSGGHIPRGYWFTLPHDVAGTPEAQTDWRFCGKCRAMFFDGYPQKGACPATGVHQAAGYNFVLPHQPPGPVDTMDAQERQLFALVDNARQQQNGCPPLQIERLLVDAARFHSQDLADHPGLWEKTWNGFPGHLGSDGSTPPDRITQAVGSPGAENVYVGYVSGSGTPPTPQDAFDWWMGEPAHKENLLNCNHKTSGIGIAYGTGTSPTGDPVTYFYFTQDFHD